MSEWLLRDDTILAPTTDGDRASDSPTSQQFNEWHKLLVYIAIEAESRGSDIYGEHIHPAQENGRLPTILGI